MSCGVGHRHGSDLVLLWLWCRLEAVVSIRPLAWEPPYAMGVALKKTKRPKKKKKKRKKKKNAKDDHSENIKRGNMKKMQTELKNTITKLRHTLEEINSRLDNTEKWI